MAILFICVASLRSLPTAKLAVICAAKDGADVLRNLPTSKSVAGGETFFGMPEEETVERAREDEREGKAPSTQAGEFVREEMEHIREGEHGARSPEQAIAIGLSKARRVGVKLPPPKRGKERIKRQAKRDLAKGRAGRRKKPSRKRVVGQFEF